MNNAPALASRKVSRGRVSQSGKSIEKRMNSDLNTMGTRIGAFIASKKARQVINNSNAAQISFIYNAAQDESQIRMKNDVFPRDISTKLYVKSRDISPNLSGVSPSVLTPSNRKTTEISQPKIKVEHSKREDEGAAPVQIQISAKEGNSTGYNDELNSMLFAVVGEGQTPPKQGPLPPNNQLSSPQNQRQTQPQMATPLKGQHQLTNVPSLLGEIQLVNLRNSKKSVQHESHSRNRLLQHPTTTNSLGAQRNKSFAKHQNSSNLQLQKLQSMHKEVGAIQNQQHQVNSKMLEMQSSSKSNIKSNASHQMINLKVPQGGLNIPLTSESQPKMLFSDQKANKRLIEVTAKHLQKEEASLVSSQYHDEKVHGAGGSSQVIETSLATNQPQTGAAVTGSAKNLYNAARIQRIQIINKPSGRNNQSNNNANGELKEASNEEGVDSPTRPLVGGQVRVLRGNASQDNTAVMRSVAFAQVKESSRVGPTQVQKSQSQEGVNQSTPQATSSHQSHLQATQSSYLHFQRFSRDGKQILKQIQTSPGVISTHQQHAKNNQTSPSKNMSGVHSPLTSKNVSLSKSGHCSPKNTAKVTNDPIMKENQKVIGIQNDMKTQTSIGTQNVGVVQTVASNETDLNFNNYQVLPVEENSMLEVVSKQVQEKTDVSNNENVFSSRKVTKESSPQNSAIRSKVKDSFPNTESMSSGTAALHTRSKVSFSLNTSKNQFQAFYAGLQSPFGVSGAQISDGASADFLTSNSMQKSSIQGRKNTDYAYTKTSKNATDEVYWKALNQLTHGVTGDLQGNSTKRRRGTVSNLPNKSQRLPKLQFVVKYAQRSRHESTIRHRNFDLKGSKTHIMPLNLIHQNSLYLVQDQELQKLYDQKHPQNKQAFDTANKRKNLFLSSADDFTRIVPDSAGSPTSQDNNSSQENQEMTTYQNQKVVNEAISNTHALLSSQNTPNSSSLAWLRQKRRTFGYIRSYDDRPKKTVNKLPTQHQFPQAAESIDGAKGFHTGWDDLSKQLYKGSNILPVDLIKSNVLIRSGDPVQDQKVHSERGEDQTVASMGKFIPPSSGLQSTSNERASSIGHEDNSTMMKPKMSLPAVQRRHFNRFKMDQGSNNQNIQYNDNLALTQTNFFGQKNEKMAIEAQGENNLDSSQNEDQIVPKIDRQVVQRSVLSPPRTSQMEKRRRIMDEQVTPLNEDDNNKQREIRVQRSKGDEFQRAVDQQKSEYDQGNLLNKNSTFRNSLGFKTSHIDSVQNVGSSIKEESCIAADGLGQTQTSSNDQMARAVKQILSDHQNRPNVFRVDAPGRHSKGRQSSSPSLPLKDPNQLQEKLMNERHSILMEIQEAESPKLNPSSVINALSKQYHKEFFIKKQKRGRQASKSPSSPHDKALNQLSQPLHRAPLIYNDASLEENSSSSRPTASSKVFNAGQNLLKRTQLAQGMKIFEQESKVGEGSTKKFDKTYNSIVSSEKFKSGNLNSEISSNAKNHSPLNGNENQNFQTDKERQIEQLRQIQQQVGHFSGLNAFLGLNPRSKQSQLIRARLHKILSSAHSPFQGTNSPVSGGNLQHVQNGLLPNGHLPSQAKSIGGLRASWQRNERNDDITTVLVRQGLGQKNTKQSTAAVEASQNTFSQRQIQAMGGKDLKEESLYSKNNNLKVCSSWHDKVMRRDQRMRDVAVMMGPFEDDSHLNKTLKLQNTTASLTRGSKSFRSSGQTAIDGKARFTGAGVQVKRGGQVSPGIKDEEALVKAVGLKSAANSQDSRNAGSGGSTKKSSNNRQSTILMMPTKDEQTVNIIVQRQDDVQEERQIIIGQHSGDQTNVIISEDPPSPSRKPQSQEQKFVVQVRDRAARNKTIKTVSSLGKLTQVDERESKASNALAANDKNHNKNTDKNHQNDIDENRRSMLNRRSFDEENQTQLKMTQASPSDIENEDIVGQEIDFVQINKLGQGEVSVSINSSPRVVNEDSNGASLTSGSQLNHRKFQLAQEWRLNNDSVQNEDLEKERIARDQVSSRTVVSGSDSTSDRKKSQFDAYIRPGINKILPQKLVQELVESQGQRQIAKWLHSSQIEQDSTSLQEKEFSTTREYLMRKFNSSKRQKEVNFFRQAQRFQLTSAQTPLSPHTQDISHNISSVVASRRSVDISIITSKGHSNIAVMDYEGANKQYKLSGVNVLTGAKTRSKQ